MKHSKNIKRVLLLLMVLLAVNVLATFIYHRFDLTENKRYTLSKPTKEITGKIKKPIVVTVYLKGDFPSNFRRLKNEVRYSLEEFSTYNHHIKFKFVNPLQKSDQDAQEVGKEFFQNGMPPRRLNVRKNGKNSETLLFPWAVATYGNKTVKIPLLKMNPEAKNSNEGLVNNSVQNLEYAFANAFKRLTTGKRKKIAVMRGNGELSDLQIGSFLKAVGAYYHVAPFTLDSVQDNPQKTLKQLEGYDLIVEPKPTTPFSEEEKLVLDQYLMNGGKELWLVESVAVEKDSLFNTPQHSTLAYPRDLKLTNFFFKYGVRILPSLVNDLHADSWILASGEGEQTQFNPYPWYYSPLVVPDSDHPIVHNIDPVGFEFANPMDTLKNGIQKTILLKSSVASRVEGTPKEISLRQIDEKPDFKTYQNKPQNLAVLLEGKFTSLFKNRVKPFDLPNFKESSQQTKMIVVSDGDVIKNEVRKGRPTDLAYDPHTGKSYGNKEFLVNAVNYMLDDSGLLNIRTKKVRIPFLDSDKTAENRLFWQVFNLAAPLLLLLIFGAGFWGYRRKKYR